MLGIVVSGGVGLPRIWYLLLVVEIRSVSEHRSNLRVLGLFSIFGSELADIGLDSPGGVAARHEKRGDVAA